MNQNAIPAIIADIITTIRAGQPFARAFTMASPALGFLLEKNAIPGDSTTREKDKYYEKNIFNQGIVNKI